MEMHERIKELRKKHLRMSQTAFGQKLGVNRDVINNIENNRLAKPEQKLSLIKLMCKEFSVSEEWLLNGTEPMFIEPDTFSLDQYAKERGASKLELAIVKAFFDLPKDVRSQMLEKLKSLLNGEDEVAAELVPNLEMVKPPATTKPPQEMSDAELHAELDRQLAEQKKRAENPSAYGRGGSGTVTG